MTMAFGSVKSLEQQSPSCATRCAGAAKTAARFAKGLAMAFALLTAVSAGFNSAIADDAPVAFIRALGDQALSVINRRDMSPGSKSDYFGRLIRQDFDLPGISRFVLGPYWRTASPAEQQEFANLFTERLIKFYGRRLAESGDGNFVVTGSRTGPDGLTVTSRIVSRQAAPIALDWRLAAVDGHYSIEDVAIDGVSMALAQRSEIGQLIARRGGQVRMLLASMRNEG
jgi:phospholipid transport system substrate-binding protein